MEDGEHAVSVALARIGHPNVQIGHVVGRREAVERQAERGVRQAEAEREQRLPGVVAAIAKSKSLRSMYPDTN